MHLAGERSGLRGRPRPRTQSRPSGAGQTAQRAASTLGWYWCRRRVGREHQEASQQRARQRQQQAPTAALKHSGRRPHVVPSQCQLVRLPEAPGPAARLYFQALLNLSCRPRPRVLIGCSPGGVVSRAISRSHVGHRRGGGAGNDPAGAPTAPAPFTQEHVRPAPCHPPELLWATSRLTNARHGCT